MLRGQAEALEAAGRALEETAGLVKSQAELFERTIGVLREPAERARTAAGLDRRDRKRGGANPVAALRPSHRSASRARLRLQRDGDVRDDMGAESRPWTTSSLVSEGATGNQRQAQGRSRVRFVRLAAHLLRRHISRAVLPATDVCLCIAGICPPPRRPSSRRKPRLRGRRRG